VNQEYRSEYLSKGHHSDLETKELEPELPISFGSRIFKVAFHSIFGVSCLIVLYLILEHSFFAKPDGYDIKKILSASARVNIEVGDSFLDQESYKGVGELTGLYPCMINCVEGGLNKILKVDGFNIDTSIYASPGDGSSFIIAYKNVPRNMCAAFLVRLNNRWDITVNGEKVSHFHEIPKACKEVNNLTLLSTKYLKPNAEIL